MKSYDSILWRNSGLMAKLGFGVGSIDARAFIPIVGVVFHISWTTLWIFLVVVGFFWFLDYLGYTFTIAMRKARSIVAGKTRYVQKTIARQRRIVNG